MKIHIDGQLLDEADARISVFDHGLLYGDGVFEGIRFYNRRVFRLEEHTKRLYDSARSILLKIPVEPDGMIAAVLETCRANGLDGGYIRLLVTRGPGPLGLSPFKCPKPSVIIIACGIQLYPEEAYQTGLAMATCALRRPAHDSLSPQVKSLNYLNNVMAKAEAVHAGAEEGLLLNERGLVAEGTGDNIFIVRSGGLLTPPVTAGALDGITRRAVIELAAGLGIPLREAEFSRHDVFTADECFLTGTAAEVIAATKLDQRIIGDGKPGPVTGRIVKAFRELTRTTGTPF
jgi:branched-chain amino acid aminotransferase